MRSPPLLSQRPFRSLGARRLVSYDHVCRADALLAVDTLLVTDTLFKGGSAASRKRYVALTESVAAHGGVVRVFSSLHGSGEQLGQLSGVAALLRFPLAEEAVLGDAAADGRDGTAGRPWAGSGGDDGDDDERGHGPGGEGTNRVFSDGDLGGADLDFGF